MYCIRRCSVERKWQDESDNNVVSCGSGSIGPVCGDFHENQLSERSVLWARHEKSAELDRRGERNYTSRYVPKTSVHAPVLTEEQNQDISDVCKTVILFMRMRIVTTRLTYVHSAPARGVCRIGRSEVSNYQFVAEYIRLCFSTLHLFSVRYPKLLSRIALLPLEQ